MKKFKLASLAVFIVAIAGCSSVKPSNEEPEIMAARQCTDQVYTMSKNKTGTITLTSIMKDASTYIRVGDSSQATHHIQGIPYAESTALDSGKPGSAWHKCMQVKGFNIPQV
ncbi:hypothetical protein D3C80_1013540 [compost metagenome]